MEKKQRLLLAMNMEHPDRPPILGGWMAAPGHIQSLSGCSEDEYWDDPVFWGIEAERLLGSDGLIDVFVPASKGEFRCVDDQIMAKRAQLSADGIMAEIEALPTPAELEANFDPEVAFVAFRAEFRQMQDRCGEMLWCPADFQLVPRLLGYLDFNYENAFLAMGLYPEEYQKVFEYSAQQGRQRAILRARAIREGIHPPAILTGEDLCSQWGPMISPSYLRKSYFPLVEYAIEPLLEVGAKIIWHCDGDYRTLIHDVLACGVGGLQGFQEECGMDLSWIRDLRTRNGDPLLIVGGMSVTQTLPFGSPQDIQDEVRRTMELCRDHVSLVFFPSNTIIPDIPLENIQTFWRTVCESPW